MKCEEVDLTGFLNSELDPELTEAVAQHLEQCADCPDRLRLLLEMRLNRTELARMKKPAWHRGYFWPIAAALLLVVLLGIWVGLRPPPTYQLAVNAPYPLIPPELRAPRVSTEFQEAAQAYAQQRWPEAERKFRQCLDRDPSNYDAAFYLANAEYMLDKHLESERLLSRLADRNPADNRVLWYLANARLKLGDAAGARPVLEKLAERSGEYHDEAKSLLRRMPH